MNNLSKHRDYFPANSLALLSGLCAGQEFILKLSRPRLSKLGDFRVAGKGKIPVITVNTEINAFHFLFIFLHEFAHFLVHKNHPKKVKPHGPEWKYEFSCLLEPFIASGIFPDDLSGALQKFMSNPRATCYGDPELLVLFRSYDAPSMANELTLLDLKENGIFKLENGRLFQKIKKMRSRFLCREQPSGKLYLIHGHAMVSEVLND